MMMKCWTTAFTVALASSSVANAFVVPIRSGRANNPSITTKDSEMMRLAAGADQLLSEFTLGGQPLENRVVLAPMTRARCTPTEDPFDITCSLPNDIMGTYYEQRANGNLLITEGTIISDDGAGWRNAPRIDTPQHAQAWKPIVDKVHAKNALFYVQLWHIGRQSHSTHQKAGRIVGASEIPMEGTVKSVDGENVEPENPHALTLEEIQSTIQDYVQAAKMAKEAGFDGVEIHSANGYLIDTFFQSCSNTRTDKYGGSMANRARILEEIVEAIVESGAYPANRIGFRLSPNGVFGGMGSEDNPEMFEYIAQTMNKYGLAYLHLMDGLGFGYHEKARAVTAFDMKKHFDGPIIVNVGLTRDTAEGMIRSGAADLACFGRPYIANPDLVERFANDWPLEPESEHENWWYPTAEKGYTDYNAYEETKKKKFVLF